MASKIYKLMVGGASVGAGTYFTTWILTGENPMVYSILLKLLLLNY